MDRNIKQRRIMNTIEQFLEKHGAVEYCISFHIGDRLACSINGGSKFGIYTLDAIIQNTKAAIDIGE